MSSMKIKQHVLVGRACLVMHVPTTGHKTKLTLLDQLLNHPLLIELLP